ncbi:xylose and arabinose reductase [Schizosaccharomyces japonicus yFS275]|uniref:Xylose and arabinose reductase n=1 Tax=Schizosaccharomyces japonicus (strain yFS275 / FY16936) TaxID=402676 RepID=B6K5I4_SCHJY|nr:xylose and arabinose reductase [Schizosaccharomyces japonicus yFS275]EEB08788.1 xylose and arabinose reductase [Schizosaccharomyces japonicus yFS275]
MLGPLVTLNCGLKCPQLGFGTYTTRLGQCRDSVYAALQAGYRHIDSAQMYHNERQCGEAIQQFMQDTSTKREEIWFTTKLQDLSGYEHTRRAIDGSLKECGLGYIDLFLLHSPYGDRLGCWKAMEEAVQEGKIRAIGVSNFGPHHIQQLLDSQPQIVPAVNQIELHPFCSQQKVVEYCQQHNIVLAAYAPLAHGEKFGSRKLLAIAHKYNKNEAQIMIRFLLQKGFIPLPKSTTPSRIKSNGEVFDFELTKEDMQTLQNLDEDYHSDWNPTISPL